MPSLRFMLFTGTVIPKCLAGYTLTKSYTASNFFEAFDFFTGPDPTHGTVQYQSLTNANATGLAGVTSWGEFTNLIYLGVDSKHIALQGRQSTRVSSRDVFNHGLFVADIIHAPSGICGTWPAFWLLGQGQWPYGGEIDIMEGVNTGQANQMTLHTSPGCSFNSSHSDFLGNQLTSDCNSVNTISNTGCAIKSTNPETYGAIFNANFGGVYVTEWTSSFIKIWFFPRHSIPQDILHSNPVPLTDTWGLPQAVFPAYSSSSSNSHTNQAAANSCSIDTHFSNMQIIIDTTLCGDWASADWKQGSSSCKLNAATCQEWVINHPEAFKQAFWAISSIEVFEMKG